MNRLKVEMCNQTLFHGLNDNIVFQCFDKKYIFKVHFEVPAIRLNENEITIHLFHRILVFLRNKDFVIRQWIFFSYSSLASIFLTLAPPNHSELI